MNVFFILAFVALLATIVTLVLGIRSMTHGGEEDRETSLMFRRVEFQAAAIALVLAAVFVAGGWVGGAPTPSDRLTVDLGVLPAEQIREQYGPDSKEASAYGGVSEVADAYLVTVAVSDRASGERIEDATVSATVSQLGLSGATRELRPSSFGGALTYGNYFRMPKPGQYRIDVVVDRPELEGTDLIRLQYYRP